METHIDNSCGQTPQRKRSMHSLPQKCYTHVMTDITKTCTVSAKPFSVTDEDQTFYQKVGPHFDGQHFPIPHPDLHPEERKRRRLSFRNLRHVYSRNCDKTGEKIMSYFDKDSPYTVYGSDVWWSDKWDALDYGRDFDFNRNFFEQFEELFKAVPHLNRSVLLTENCEFINGAANCKNCYLSFNMDYCEDCFYLTEAKHCKDCVDSYNLIDCELCYESQSLERCYNIHYSTRSIGCRDSFFLTDCRQCKNCIGCVNLVGKEYHVFNQRVTPEKFKQYKEAFKSRKYTDDFKEKFADFSLKFPKKYYFGHSNENFSGDNIQNSKNSHDCYISYNLENCKHCYYIFSSNNCMDYDLFGDNSEWIYNCITTGLNCSNDICCMHTWNSSSNNLYCYLLSGASNNFGSVGLKKQQYCILNKKYSKEEYEKLVAKIIQHMQKTGEWGEFFPPSISPFGYNETMAHEFFPLTKEEALAKGYHWKNKVESGPQYEGGGDISIPDNIDETDDSITNKVIKCKETGKPFKIIPQEFTFHKNLGLPLPCLAPEVRHQHRFAKQNPQQLWQRKCAKTGQNLLTTYAPDRPEIIYSEEAYLEEVF